MCSNFFSFLCSIWYKVYWFKLITSSFLVKILSTAFACFISFKLSWWKISIKSKNFFTWKLKLQIDGVAMGSPLEPVLANLFMGFYEKQWLKEFSFCKVLLYRRYVDDIICLFNCEVDAMKFFGYLNSRYPNIKSHLKNKSVVS